nr:UDP-glycosyltransferase 76G1-like [Tanacetum cinerariifolium]
EENVQTWSNDPQEMFLAAEHRYCLKHIYDNMKLSWRGKQYKELLWKSATSPTVQLFEKNIEELRRINKEVYDWLKLIPPHHWARFKINPCNGPDMWKKSPSPITLTPPDYHTPVGRPTKKRKKSTAELFDGVVKKGKLSRAGKSVTCTKCSQVGHNSRSCKGQRGTTVNQSQASQASASISARPSGNQSQASQASASASARPSGNQPTAPSIRQTAPFLRPTAPFVTPRLIKSTTNRLSPIKKPAGANGFLAFFNFTKQDSEYERPVPKYPILKVKDIIKITPNPKGFGEYNTKVVKQIKASSGIIWNSFIELEAPTLETLNHDFPIPKFSLGPLQMYFPASPSSVLEQDRSFFSWLDAQAPKSVIYLSFGSVARITKLEFLEVAYGLANIDFPFLWVVRPGVVKGSEWLEWLPEKFLEEVGDRGRIVKWCPQQEVLAHPSTGCFWTHSGWNSTLESICKEVPMICSPCVVGQPIIARYVNDIWKISVLLEDGFERVGIERAVKKIMLDEEGEEIRQRISRVKKEVDISFDEGGSSHRSLKSLVDYSSSF